MDWTEIIITIIVSVSGLLQLIIRNHAKAIKKEQDEQKVQSSSDRERIVKMETKLDHNSDQMRAILERQKKQDEYIDKKTYSDRIPTLIKNKMIQILDDNYIENREFRVQALSAARKIGEIVQSVMESNFPKNTPVIIENELVSAAKEIRSTINEENLDSENPSLFIQNVKKQAVLLAIRQFSFRTKELMHLKNGDRLQKFEDLSIRFVENMTDKIISLM